MLEAAFGSSEKQQHGKQRATSAFNTTYDTILKKIGMYHTRVDVANDNNR